MRDRDGNLVLVYQDGFMQRIGQTGPVEASYVCVQTRDGLVAFDPVKGSILWTKSGVSARTHLFGDGQYVFMVDVNGEGLPSSAARAIRAEDGVAVPVPDFTEPYQRKLRVVGRTILARDELPQGEQVMRLYDVYSGKDLWKKTFPPSSIVLKADDHDLAGVIEPNGTTTVFDVRNQKEVLRASLDWREVLDGRETSIASVLDKVTDAHLVADRNHYYIALNKPAGGDSPVTGFWPNTYLMRSLPVNGMVYAFDKGTGTPRWANDVHCQMLVLEQFSDLPMLLFTARQNKKNGVPVQATRGIHKQSGRLLYDKELNNGNQFHGIRMDAKGGKLDLVSWNFKIHFELENPPAGQ
jgi:outer membrane protein assembly factor BamB